MLCMPSIKTLRSFTSFFPLPLVLSKAFESKAKRLVVNHVAGLGLYHFGNRILVANEIHQVNLTRTKSSLSLFLPSFPSLLARRKPNLLKLIKMERRRIILHPLSIKAECCFVALFQPAAWAPNPCGAIQRLVYELDECKSSGGPIWQSLDVHAFHLKSSRGSCADSSGALKIPATTSPGI